MEAAIRDHKAWLGYLQPDGLVVSPAALVDSQVVLSQNTALLQRHFIEKLIEVGQDGEKRHTIGDLPSFLRDFLQWPVENISGIDEQKPVPESLRIPLREFGETLEPDMAFSLNTVGADNDEWLLLIKDLPVGVDLDKPVESAIAGWTASPTRRFERLLREAEVSIGLICNGTQFRLVYAPRGENSGTLTFNVADMAEVSGRPILGAFDMLLSRYRLLAAPGEARLPALLQRSRDYQARVSVTLAQQVLDALYELLRGFQTANSHENEELLLTTLDEDPDSIYSGLLTVLLRLVFLLYAEDRGLMPDSSIYLRNYSVHSLFERLRDDAEHYPDTMDHRYGAWAQLLALFHAIHGGCRHPQMEMPPRSGYLFDPGRFPFLEGQTLSNPRVPLVSDNTIFNVLEKLFIVDGERLSYRTLDVEEIGSVYQTIMGFRLEITSGMSIAITGKRKHKGSVPAPIVINLEELLNTRPSDRKKWIKDATEQELTGNADKALKEADSIDDLLAALERKIARNASPYHIPKDGLILQPTEERRSTGSHYTPRSFTEPIVSTTLRPILECLGEHPTPEQLLELKIADIAVGSGAFLVEACRQLGEKLIEAWHYHDQLPSLPPDEDEILLARREIAQRCLYGLDRNPMAVDLAKLSLWLATLAKDHPFTFLDHSFRCGDALVGLTRRQIAGFHWEPEEQLTFLQKELSTRITKASDARGQILAAGDDIPPSLKQQKLKVADDALDIIRTAGNLVVSAYFSGNNARQRKDQITLLQDNLEKFILQTDLTAWNAIQQHLEILDDREYVIRPFHWEIEFPEVFHRENPGFDAIIGNPPFIAGRTIGTNFGNFYRDWLLTNYPTFTASSDLVALFFRNAFNLIRNASTFGLIATKTISKGDTRSAGLRWVCQHGGSIYSAFKRIKWPGEASVVVSVIHVIKGDYEEYELDGVKVPLITAFLFTHGGHDDPLPLLANNNLSFNGCSLSGVGFTFDDNSQRASTIAEMNHLIKLDPRNAELIRPFLGGDELNSSPTHSHHRWVIFFGEMTLEEAKQWPDLLQIVEEKVRSERQQKGQDVPTWPWWHFARSRPAMMAAIQPLKRMLTVSFVSEHLGFVWLPTDRIVSHNVGVFANESDAFFAILQSRIHEIFATQLSSGLEDRQGYRPSDGFEPFPFPSNWILNDRLESIGREYYDHRSKLMINNNEGLTKTYNRFHNPNDNSSDILVLRELHSLMDQAVLDSYGWNDIPIDCEFLLDYEDDEENDNNKRKKPWRYRWPEDIRDEVLARLLKLNAERAEEELRSGEVASAAEKKKTQRVRRKRTNTSPNQQQLI